MSNDCLQTKTGFLIALSLSLGGIAVASWLLIAGEKVANEVEMTSKLGEEPAIVRQDGKVIIEWELKNNSSSMLSIRHMVTTCTCSTPEAKKREIEPGGTGIVSVTVAPGRRRGEMDAMMEVVYALDGSPGLRVMPFVKRVRIDPDIVTSTNLIEFTPKSEAEFQLVVWAQHGSVFRVTNVSCDRPWLTAEKMSDGEKTRIAVVMDRNRETSGSWSGTLTIETDSEKDPRIVVPIAGSGHLKSDGQTGA